MMLTEVRCGQPLSRAAHLFKIDEGVNGLDNDEGWLHGVELCGGFPVVISLHPQHLHPIWVS
jgi:hypothetical protein